MLNTPPDYLLRFGNPIEQGYFHVNEGNISHEGGITKCSFEVLYTLAGEIIVACKFSDLENFMQVFGIKENEAYSFKPQIVSFSKLEGVLDGSNTLLVVEKGVELLRSYHIEPAIFIAQNFTLNVTPQTFLETNGYIHAVGINIFTCTNIPPKIFQQFSVGSNSVFQLGMSYVNENQMDDTNDDKYKLTLAKLFIEYDKVFLNWELQDIASFFCALMSLAIGFDVRWVSHERYSENNNLMLKTYQSRRNLFFERRGRPYIQQFPIEMRLAASFVSAAFHKITTGIITQEAALDYMLSINHFTEYSLLTRRAEDQARLIVTAIEELLTKWEKYNISRKVKGTMTDRQISKLYKSIEQEAEKYLSQGDLIADLDINKNRLREVLNELARPRFKDRVKSVFLSADEIIIKDWASEILFPERLNSFIKTRNKIVHEGVFSNDITGEYLNMLMILPFMMFAIFGYKGVYVDHYDRYMKNKHNRKELQSS